MEPLYTLRGNDHFRLGGPFNADRLWSTTALTTGQVVLYAEDIHYQVVRHDRENDGYVHVLRLLQTEG